MTIDIYKPELAAEYRTKNVLQALLILGTVRRPILSGTKKQIPPCIFLWRYKK